MPVVNRKEGESFDSLVRRFNKTIQRSGRTTEVKRRRFFERPDSPLKSKRKALRRDRINRQLEYLRKIDQYDDVMDASSRKKIISKIR
jgi:ribosomal protein S21